MFSTASTTNQDFAHQFNAAYVTTAADRDALAPDDLLPVNLDVQVAITTVLGVMPKINALRPEISAKLPAENAAQIDKAETYARALAYAQIVYLAASTPAEVLPELAERALKSRDLLHSDAKALAHRGLIDGKPLADLKGGPGYLNIASDLGVLVRMLRDRWTAISSKSAIQPSEIDEAEMIFEQITMAYAERSQQPAHVAKASDDRQRAYTLLVKTYDQVRRAVVFIRWEAEDAETFAPSLWAGRGSRSSKAEAPAKTETPAPTPAAAPSPSPPAPPAAPTGLPGSSPFADS